MWCYATGSTTGSWPPFFCCSVSSWHFSCSYKQKTVMKINNLSPSIDWTPNHPLDREKWWVAGSLCYSGTSNKETLWERDNLPTNDTPPGPFTIALIRFDLRKEDNLWDKDRGCVAKCPLFRDSTAHVYSIVACISGVQIRGGRNTEVKVGCPWRSGGYWE